MFMEWMANLNISESPNSTYYIQGSAHMPSLPPPTLSNSHNILTVFLLWHLSFSISDYSYLCIYLHFPNKVKLSETKAISRSPPKSDNTQFIKVLNKCCGISTLFIYMDISKQLVQIFTYRHSVNIIEMLFLIKLWWGQYPQTANVRYPKHFGKKYGKPD